MSYCRLLLSPSFYFLTPAMTLLFISLATVNSHLWLSIYFFPLYFSRIWSFSLFPNSLFFAFNYTECTWKMKHSVVCTLHTYCIVLQDADTGGRICFEDLKPGSIEVRLITNLQDFDCRSHEHEKSIWQIVKNIWAVLFTLLLVLILLTSGDHP